MASPSLSLTTLATARTNASNTADDVTLKHDGTCEVLDSSGNAIFHGTMYQTYKWLLKNAN